ncbi:MAG: prolipoprotein diacylglyceryl transferase [Spirochaetia bacterium]|jgi:phosphatidylglycerol:prolipoprotein diacylglycerol transferase
MLAYIQYPSWIHPEIIPWLPIRWYGLMYLVAFVITYLLFTWQLRARKEKPSQDLVLDMFFWGIIGLLIGARAFAVTIYDATGYYLSHPLQIILPVAMVDGKLRLTGIAGMSYHGGLVGAVIALAIFMRVKKLNILDWGDMLVAGIPLGYTFGRLGNFINGELYGRITRVPWGMVFPGAEGFPGSQPWVRDFAQSVGMQVSGAGLVNLPRHPSQLYEAFFEGFVLWLIIWFIVRKRKPYNGVVIAWYMIGYGVFRFFIEYAREPDKGIGFPITLVPLSSPGQFSWFNFTTGQILNVLLIAGAVIALAVFRARALRQPVPQDAGPRPSARKLRKKVK